MAYHLNSGSYSSDSSWISVISNSLAPLLGLSAFASYFSGSRSGEETAAAAKMLVLGVLIEGGRSLYQWLVERINLRLWISAEFSEGDPTYDWILLLLTEQEVWRHSKDFRVTAKSSQRRWGIKASSSDSKESDNAEYIPTYELSQMFRYNGHWIECTRHKPNNPYPAPTGVEALKSKIHLTIYSWDTNVLTQIVESARLRYLQTSRPDVIIRTCGKAHIHGPYGIINWNESVMRKPRRPLRSIVLEGNTLETLIEDAKEFVAMEDWYIDAGIPHRRGYLLHGPPGTGKTSTIYAVAGELGMEIYSISLAASGVDDNFLAKAAASIPKHSIFLIEDIDCAFPPREDENSVLEAQVSQLQPHPFGMGPFPPAPPTLLQQRPSLVTLSGLLNVLDGVGSEEGRLFFATTNHVDHLDPALIRPGRVDMKVEYKLASKRQAAAMFSRFYPAKHIDPSRLESIKEGTFDEKLERLANDFSDAIPDHEFSTAELQGYLLVHKLHPVAAASDISGWVESQQQQREEARKKEQEKREKLLKDLERLAGSGMMMSHFPPPPPPPTIPMMQPAGLCSPTPITP